MGGYVSHRDRCAGTGSVHPQPRRCLVVLLVTLLTWTTCVSRIHVLIKYRPQRTNILGEFGRPHRCADAGNSRGTDKKCPCCRKFAKHRSAERRTWVLHGGPRAHGPWVGLHAKGLRGGKLYPPGAPAASCSIPLSGVKFSHVVRPQPPSASRAVHLPTPKPVLCGLSPVPSPACVSAVL